MDSQQQQTIIARFNSDETFKKNVLQDANMAVKKEFGIDLPFPMRVIADGPNYRIEPISGGADDLTDVQLELATGGKGGGGHAPATRFPPMTIGGFGRVISNDGGS